MESLQQNADQAGAPGGMRATPVQDLLAEVRAGRLGRSGGMVGGSESLHAVVLQAAQEPTHRPWVELESLSDLEGRLATLKALPNSLAERKRNGCGHSRTSEKRQKATRSRMTSWNCRKRSNWVAVFHGQTGVGISRTNWVSGDT
jgi:hypothetical protein